MRKRNRRHPARGLLANAATGVIAALLLAVAAPAGQAKEAVLVTVDQAMLLRLPGEARSIVIGNPSIADATILNATTLVITGRSFGTTNIIVMDAAGVTIAEELLTVQSNLLQVTVYRRSTRETYSCTPICQLAPLVGDATGIFDATTAQVQTRTAMAAGN